METFKIQLHTIQDIKDFITASNMQCSDIDVISGHYVVDAKSIMGLFSLDLSKVLTIKVHGTASDVESFREAVKNVVVDE